MEHPLPILACHVLKEADVGNSCIVYQNINPAELLFYLPKELLAAGHISHISPIGQAGDLEGFYLFFGLKEPVLPVDAADGHIISLFCKLYSDGFPDSPGCAGDKHGFSGHINTSFLSLFFAGLASYLYFITFQRHVQIIVRN